MYHKNIFNLDNIEITKLILNLSDMFIINLNWLKSLINHLEVILLIIELINYLFALFLNIISLSLIFERQLHYIYLNNIFK
jgi:hypothetical protein